MGGAQFCDIPPARIRPWRIKYQCNPKGVFREHSYRQFGRPDHPKPEAVIVIVWDVIMSYSQRLPGKSPSKTCIGIPL